MENDDSEAKRKSRERLNERKEFLKQRQSFVRRAQILILTLSSLSLVSGSLIVWEVGMRSTPSPVWATGIVVALAMLPYNRGRLKTIEHDLLELDFEIDLLLFTVNPREIRAEKILRISGLELKRYYDLNITENILVFGLGIVCILLGIFLICITLHLVLNVASSLDAQIITAVLGTVGSLLSSYIAAIYLKMHASATARLGAFHSRLVETQQLLFGNLLASRIEDDNKRWETLSQIAVNMARASPHSVEAREGIPERQVSPSSPRARDS